MDASYILFIVDDNLFVRDFSLMSAVAALEREPAAIGFSLRLGRNITHSYTTQHSQVVPEHVELSSQILKFKWSQGKHDFGYPLEVSSSIYRLHEIAAWVGRLGFNGPNGFEAAMASKAHFFKLGLPFLLSYSTSVTFCNPINKVQLIVPNRSGSRSDYSAEQLSSMFDCGLRVDVDKYSGIVPRSCHQEVELVLSTHDLIEAALTLS